MKAIFAARAARAQAIAPFVCLALLLHVQVGGAQVLATDAAQAIVITATRAEQPLAEALPSVTVITREQIDATQSRDLIELLGRQPGIEFARNGGQGAVSSIFLRGTNSNHVLVLVDGVRVNSVLGGAANLGGYATDAIDHIEIVRGNLSSLYGSEAIGGVVQIFTRAAVAPGAQVLAEAGQGRTRDASASVSTRLGDAGVRVSAGYRAQKAFPAIDVAQVPYINPADDGNWNRNGALRLDQRGTWGELRAWVWGSRNDTDWADAFNGSATIPTARIAQVEHRSQDGAGASLTRLLGSSKIQLTAAQTRDDAVNVSNVANTDPLSDGDNSQYRSRNRQVTLQDTTALARGVDLVAGWEHLNQWGASTSYDPSFLYQLTGFSRRVDSLWLGSNARTGAQQWQVNVRNDRYSDFGSAMTGLFGWGWSIDPAWKLVAQASTAFRAPAFDDLYLPPQYGGNPQLGPERAHSAELGLRWNQGASSASLAMYRNRVAGLIAPGPRFVLVNIGHAAMDGGELQAQTMLGALRAGGSLTLDRPRDMDTGLALVRRAHTNARLWAVYESGPWSGSAELQRTGARDDYAILTFVRTGSLLPAYNLARAGLQYRINDQVKVSLRVENLFQAHYELVDGYNTLPRTLIGGVEARI